MKSEIDIPNFKIVEDVRITVRAELDRRAVPFPELMKLETGAILELSRPTGENVDLYVGPVLIGSGEILVIESALVVRIADLGDKASENGEDLDAR